MKQLSSFKIPQIRCILYKKIQNRKIFPTTVLSRQEKALIVAFRKHTLLSMDDYTLCKKPYQN